MEKLAKEVNKMEIQLNVIKKAIIKNDTLYIEIALRCLSLFLNDVFSELEKLKEAELHELTRI